MTIFLIILGIYIVITLASLAGPYMEFRRDHCVKGRTYTLEDLFNRMDRFYLGACFIPPLNLMTFILSIGLLFICPLYNKIKRIRIV